MMRKRERFYNPVCKSTRDTRISRDASNSKNAFTSTKAGPLATACSKGTVETQTTPLVTPGTSAIAQENSKRKPSGT